MELIIIKARKSGHIVAVVERIPALSQSATALAWARSEGYETFPVDCSYETGVQLTSAGSVMMKLTPISQIEQLKHDAA